MNKLFVMSVIAGTAAAASAGSTLWDNGPMVTHAGAGAGGADVSMASAVPNTTGSNVTSALWRADDFTVGGPGWNVSSVVMFGYDTNFASPRWSSASISIYADAPDGTLMATSAATWELAGINRVFNGAGNLSNTARQINQITADFGSLQLDAGNYWVVLSITHSVAGTNSWTPYVMDIDPANPDNPITRIGNSRVTTNSGATWGPGNVTTGDWNQSPEIPFLVMGSVVPAPGALAVLGLGGLVAGRRRR